VWAEILGQLGIPLCASCGHGVEDMKSKDSGGRPGREGQAESWWGPRESSLFPS
jgi:hypothetical protein